jgi:hypothetical protein
VKVWRVEHEAQNYHEWPAGPYCGPARVGGLSWAHNDDEHPAPGWDRDLNGIRFNEVCGLISREALDVWFRDWHGKLSERGFVISVYDVPEDHARVGEFGQVVFNYGAATRIGAEFWEVIA